MNPKDTPDLEEQKLRELLKTCLFAAIEYGRLNHGATQDALEATYIGHLDDMMEYVDDEIHHSNNALLREIEAGTDALYNPSDTHIYNRERHGEPNEVVYLEDVKQILADARVGE